MTRRDVLTTVGGLVACAAVRPARAGERHGGTAPRASFPERSWSRSTPEAQGASSDRLQAIPPSVMGDAVVIRHGQEIWRWGDPGRVERNWASVSRPFVTTAWGAALTRRKIAGGLAALERELRDFATPTARTFVAGIRLKHLLSYTSRANPPGSRWAYSSGDHWPKQHALFREVVGLPVHECLNRDVFAAIGGGLGAVETGDDRTCRVHGSCLDMARWGYLWLRQGRWRDETLIDPAFVRRAVGGGPDGDGPPNPLEGYQMHLVRGERHREGPMPGVPDGAYFGYGSVDRGVVAVVPALDLVVARHREHGYPVETFLGAICQAVQR